MKKNILAILAITGLALGAAAIEDDDLNGLLVSTDTVTLPGTTTPKATLLVVSENGEQTTVADASGAFSLDVDLITGFNTITVYSYSTDGQEASKSLTITYSTAKI